MFKSSALLFLSLSIAAAAQSNAPAPSAPQLSPQAAYDQVLTPFEITRRSIQNWSDSETAAFAIAIHDASAACQARTPEQFSGEDLIAYARLCALGQQWPSVSVAATRYIDATGTPKPQLSLAFAFQINAAFNMKDEQHGLAASLTMLTAVPYDLTADQAMQGALHYMQLAFMADALTLYAAREPYVLKALSTANLASAAGPVPRSTLYADGLAYAALQKFAGYDDDAASTVHELDAALPAKLAPDEEIPIAITRRQYALIGSKLPAIPLAESLFTEHETPVIDTKHASTTVLLLFPPWCAQCVKMAQSVMPTLYRVSENGVHIYPLLAQAPRPVPAPPKVEKRSAKSKAQTEPAEPAAPKTAADLLIHTPTLIVPESTVSQFAATDFPLLIATDSKGIIRFIQPAPETALNEGDFLDQVAAHIAAQWPPEAPAK
jgi:thiol-disulfide isomerase/thioredoxin